MEETRDQGCLMTGDSTVTYWEVGCIRGALWELAQVEKCWIEDFSLVLVKVLEYTIWAAASIQNYQQLHTAGVKYKRHHMRHIH